MVLVYPEISCTTQILWVDLHSLKFHWKKQKNIALNNGYENPHYQKKKNPKLTKTWVTLNVSLCIELSKFCSKA